MLLGEQIGGGSKEGEAIRNEFLSQCPCIPVLIEWAQLHAEKHGWIPGLDGRKLMMRRDARTGAVQTHKALNVLLQAAGSIVMKKATVILRSDNIEKGLTCKQVIHYHDEFQFTCPAEEVEDLMDNINNCVRKAGEFFNMECALASDSMVGRSWFDTH